ncbi:MAG TPA: hypothetical protein VFK22_06070 [Candidatus Dormibacteraeota bacterium]|nr:hypothetical protein [Candidatus Dormibacteraeota bacterium]
MARKAKDEQVALRIITTPEHGQPVMDLQLALFTRHSADLAAPAALGDEPKPA